MNISLLSLFLFFLSGVLVYTILTEMKKITRAVRAVQKKCAVMVGLCQLFRWMGGGTCGFASFRSHAVRQGRVPFSNCPCDNEKKVYQPINWRLGSGVFWAVCTGQLYIDSTHLVRLSLCCCPLISAFFLLCFLGFVIRPVLIYS